MWTFLNNVNFPISPVELCGLLILRFTYMEGNQVASEGWQHGQSLAPDSRAVPAEQVQFPFGNHSLNPMDQPLEFTPRLSHENDLKMRSDYPDSLGSAKGTDTGVMSSLHPWTAPAAPVGSFPPVTPAFPLAPKVFVLAYMIDLLSISLKYIDIC